jgi:hypothetical protein
MQIECSTGELDLLIEALARAASRHESFSRYNPRAAAPHDKKAAAMRKLQYRLNKCLLIGFASPADSNRHRLG